MTEPLTSRLRKRAEIRRKLIHQQVRKEPDRIADLLEEAASEIERLRAALEDIVFDAAGTIIRPSATIMGIAKEALKETTKEKHMEQKNIMTLVWHDAVENDSASVYRVTKDDFARLATDLQNNAETDDLPKLSLEMYSEKQWLEAERVGKEMA